MMGFIVRSVLVTILILIMIFHNLRYLSVCERFSLFKFRMFRHIDFEIDEGRNMMKLSLPIGGADGGLLIYFVKSKKKPNEWMMIDTGTLKNAEVVEYFFDEIFLPKHQVLKYVVITHGHHDHFALSSQIREKTGAKIVMSEHASKYTVKGTQEPFVSYKGWKPWIIEFLVRTSLGMGYDDLPVTLPDYLHNDEFVINDLKDEFGVQVLEIPGHTLGSIGYFREEYKQMFVGDLVIGDLFTFMTKIGFHFLVEDVEMYLDSLKLVAEMGRKGLVEEIYSAHFERPISIDELESVF